MTEYVEIESPREIRRLNKLLSEKLKKALPHAETRTIGTPHGSFPAQVRFFPGEGEEVFYWSNHLSHNKLIERNYFGHGIPGAKVPLYIDVHFSVPVVRFSRKSGGTFLQHVPTKSVVLAHRGIVTIGHGRANKVDLLSEIDVTVLEAYTGRGIGKYLFIGKLDSPTLIDEIAKFAAELRRAARAIKANATRTVEKRAVGSARISTTLSGRLRQYFDEFSGKRQLKGRRGFVADCYHGTVVRTIRDAFKDATETLKSQVIDLTIVLAKRIYLFEVKTSSDPQSVYTAIGQLTAHTPIVAEYAPGKNLIRVMVVPDLPNKRLCSLMKEKLGIRLLTYTRSANGRISFDDLDQLK
ncbi:MAG: hypothetical protein ABSC77_07660 [Terracidiphilus sp.]|jgi:GNAT superfamily N-acetyltransferase